MKTQGILLIAAASAVAIYILKKLKGIDGDFWPVLNEYIPKMEGFRKYPYWDVSRYSWGYGTPAPGAHGEISQTQALKDYKEHIAADYAILKPQVKTSLNAKQWAAYLLFSYNTGPGNADNLLTNLNNRDWDALRNQWSKYIYAGGLVSDTLIRRRADEIDLFFS